MVELGAADVVDGAWEAVTGTVAAAAVVGVEPASGGAVVVGDADLCADPHAATRSAHATATNAHNLLNGPPLHATVRLEQASEYHRNVVGAPDEPGRGLRRTGTHPTRYRRLEMGDMEDCSAAVGEP